MGTHSNHSMLRTLLALGVFLIPQVSSLGYWPYGGYGLHPHGGYGLHPHGGYGLHPHGAGWGLGFGHPALHGGLGYPFGMAGLYGGLLGGYGYGGYGNGKKYYGYGGGKGYGGSYGGYGGGKGYGKGSKNYGNKGYGNSRYRRSIRGTPSYHTPTSPAHHTAHTYQPTSYGVHQAYQPFVRYQPVRFSPAQPYHGRYYARQPVRSYPGYSTRNIMY